MRWNLAMNDTVELDIKPLEQLIKALKDPPVGRVGILGAKNYRSGGTSNATIGAAHEYGTTKLPQRSFLRIPIQENLQKRLEASGALDEQVLKRVIKSGSIVPWLEKVLVIAQGIVLDAFHTGGFGKWKALSPETLRRKKVQQILVETQQLRNSITHEVVA
jgi:hypothetical protein